MRVRMISQEFVTKVLDGSKPHTIRPTPWEEGQLYSLRVWTGKPYRSKQREIGVIECTRTEQIIIGYEGILRRDSEDQPRMRKVTDPADREELDRLAKADGFDEGWPQMLGWFAARYQLPFEGYINHFKVVEPNTERSE